MATSKATDPLSYTRQNNVSGAGSGPTNILAEPYVAKCLWFLLWNRINEMHRFQSLPLHVCWSPQYSSPSYRFPTRSLYKEGDAPFPKPSSTCLLESTVEESFLRISLVERDASCPTPSFISVSKSPVKESPSRFLDGSPNERAFLFQSLPARNSEAVSAGGV